MNIDLQKNLVYRHQNPTDENFSFLIFKNNVFHETLPQTNISESFKHFINQQFQDQFG